MQSVAAGATATATLRLDCAPPLDTPVTITVQVKPVPGEEKKDNNTAEYQALLARRAERSYPARVAELTDPAGIAALAAGLVASSRSSSPRCCGAPAAHARGAAGGARRLRPRGPRAHAAGLQEAFQALHERVEEVAGTLEARMAAAEERIDGAIAYRALVRYDAYGELSGHQSASLALLDAERNGVVLSSITHRDTARLYCKQVVDGRGEHQLSPEEDEAVRRALAGERGSRHR